MSISSTAKIKLKVLDPEGKNRINFREIFIRRGYQSQ